jgi:hypothetical protein
MLGIHVPYQRFLKFRIFTPSVAGSFYILHAKCALRTLHFRRPRKCSQISDYLHALTSRTPKPLCNRGTNFSNLRGIFVSDKRFSVHFCFWDGRKEVFTVDVDEHTIDEICEQRFYACKKNPYARSSSVCRAKCSRISLEQWTI